MTGSTITMWRHDNDQLRSKKQSKPGQMRLITAFLKLVRLPNLIFIAITQVLFHAAIVHKVLDEAGRRPVLDGWDFILLIIASVVIAAAGYIINDYFDLQIDAVNKPEKVVVDKIIKRRWAIMWHWLFSGLGILLSVYISYKIGNWVIAIANVCCVLLLWFYSTTFKKRILSGNIVIAALTAWVIVVVYFFCLPMIFSLQTTIVSAASMGSCSLFCGTIARALLRAICMAPISHTGHPLPGY